MPRPLPEVDGVRGGWTRDRCLRRKSEPRKPCRILTRQDGSEDVLGSGDSRSKGRGKGGAR